MAQEIDLDLSPLNQRFGASTISNWKHGARPRARFIPEIATLLNWSLPEIVRRFWGEKIGDPCPCGCQGKQVFPNDGTQLSIELPCAACGLKRIYKPYEVHLRFCPLCLARSILFPRTLTRALMERLGVSRSTICLWQRGRMKPPAGALQVIAEVWNRPLADIVQLLWKITLGGPGICGCGINRFPKDPKARTVVIEIPCAECGPKGIRISQPGAHVNHHPLCRKCSHAGEWIEFTCIGYDDHGVNRHARTCLPPYIKRIQRQQVTNRQRQKERRSPNSRFDISSRTYQCQGCSKAERLAKKWEERIRQHHEEKFPHQNVPRIKSRSRRLELLRERSHEINPNFHKPPVRRGQKLGRKKHVGRSIVGAFIRLAFPKYYRYGFCRRCGKIARTIKKVPDFHYECGREWFSTPEGKRYLELLRQGKKPQWSLPPHRPRRGPRVTEENLKLYLSWAIQHHLGKKPYRKIAEEHGVQVNHVVKRIKFVLENLPQPEVIKEARFRRLVELLLDAALISFPV